MYKYKIFNNIAQEGIDILNENNILIDELEPDALFLRSHILKNSDFNKSLKCIGRAGAGTNNIPVDFATNNGIVVFNTPGANSNAVKELVICGMILASRGIIQGNTYTKSLSNETSESINTSIESQKKNFKGNELKGKTLGIIGLGAIGSLLARTAEVMGMKIIGYDPHISIDSAWRLPKDVQKADSLEDLLSNSDYASLHIPLNKQTKNLICSKTISSCKDGLKLINLSRGGIVNNDDVIEGLKNNKLSKFVTDFPTLELIERSSTKNDVILLPHIGASTQEAEINCAEMAAEQISNFLKNGIINNSVNFPTIRLSRSTKYRLVVINLNEPGMIGMITDEIGALDINIADMTHKTRDKIGISLIDLETEPNNLLINNIQNLENVISIRVCKQ